MNSKRLSYLALFIALSVIGASIKIPAVVGSIALDSFPALVAGALIGNIPGAVVAACGHLLSALFVGMPLGPMHIVVALEMAILVYLFSVLYRNGNKILASGSFFFGNVFLAPLPFLFLIGVSFYTAIVPSILVATAVNVCIAALITPRLQSYMSFPIVKGRAG
ncbi:ECF transporter S component [Pseudalkalibacillus berkeleyi]|uniref:ECF transporter S component n=1 Tax=Pseudalkalibacillus berkeleyi TaxID=1069813 RepID=A0ABS9GXH0_9BACL|nr:ECF transporter S component [Pseudalkalibacillus berkeleyi]MCF6137477.1 ECF transporter S component [Pseudalkalibacillus berkeleyi]